MALTMPKDSGGGSFEIVPEGNHVCVCSSIIDMGTQEVRYEGQPAKHQRKIYISWQLVGEERQDGKPFYIGKSYTYSANEKANLRKDLESWRGKKFTDDELGAFLIKNLIGKACMLNVVHSAGGDRTYANIASIASLPKGMTAPSLAEPPTYFSLEEDEFSWTVFDELSEKMQERIKLSPEYRLFASASDAAYPMQPSHVAAVESMVDDEVPF